MNLLKSLYINNLFFYLIIGIVALSVFGFIFYILFFIAQLLFIGLIVLLVIDIFLLFKHKNALVAQRNTMDKLSNGDENEITILVENNYPFPVHLEIIDELPYQFQVRNTSFELTLKSGAKKMITYPLRPTARGEYEFGAINCFASSKIGLISRKMQFSEHAKVPVYPSFIQMRHFELLAFSNRLTQAGIKKIRKIGRNTEFEKINEYVAGDDFKTINWKATARKDKLMVNQYQEEKSQNVYSIIDMGRAMKMPFKGLTLMDYAINASLVISNIIIKKYDKAGLITFNNKLKSVLKAEHKSSHIQKIMDLLYSQKTGYAESNFEELYTTIKYKLNQRSLLLLYTNFETIDSLQRQMKYLRGIAKNHLLVVIFFKNTELTTLATKIANTTEEIYFQTIAEKFAYEKKIILKQLQNNGIQAIYTSPEDLTINSINKYLEIKARQLL